MEGFVLFLSCLKVLFEVVADGRSSQFVLVVHFKVFLVILVVFSVLEFEFFVVVFVVVFSVNYHFMLVLFLVLVLEGISVFFFNMFVFLFLVLH